ncbi:Hypothetical protein, putative [Bodo saltans]|uniref:Uncharacterized protein n=1 Tax=Bodo saltans TaxID=75058 RepID=A0A0S4IMH6_BODSA|nr:Hypothetical protein, putative [Bodo saltans]|eukprot:CUE73226.1 Hypothetical protein, putative [Bodo saltans]
MPVVDLTDHVKELMVSPVDSDMPSARRQLQLRRKAEVCALYNTRAVPAKEARDPARAVLHNVYHQQLETKVPVVYKLLAGQYSVDDLHGIKDVPVVLRTGPAPKASKPTEATQTIVCEPDPIPNPPQRVDPHIEHILAAAKTVRPKSSLGVGHYDKSTGREVKSIGTEANPSDIIRATMRSTSRPLSAAARPIAKPAWIPTRTLQTNTDPHWERHVTEVPKMGTLTLKVQQKPIPQDLQPGPRSARHAHRPRDTMFIF